MNILYAVENGDEYEILLRYIQHEADVAKAKKSSVSNSEEDDKDPYTILWYAPWKKVKKDGLSNKKVPEDWLTTDMRKGLDEGEVRNRRAGFGFNELISEKENQFVKIVGYFRASTALTLHPV